jgi:hypothetical protein
MMKKTYPSSNIYGIENSPEVFNLAKKRKKENNLDYEVIK